MTMRSDNMSGCAQFVTAAVPAKAALLAAGLGVFAMLAGLATPSVRADTLPCEDAFCTPGIMGNAVLGAPCANTGTYVFGTTQWGRLVFCGSPRRYTPRYFRSPPMAGVKVEKSDCASYQNQVAQSPEGHFLTCVSRDGRSLWKRGD